MSFYDQVSLVQNRPNKDYVWVLLKLLRVQGIGPANLAIICIKKPTNWNVSVLNESVKRGTMKSLIRSEKLI